MTDRVLRIASLAFVVTIGPVGAMQLETGKWEITMQSSNPVTGQPINKTSTECIEDSNFDPAREMMEDNTCRVTDKQENDNSVSWKVVCGGGNLPVFHGEGTFISHGKYAEGEMKMVMTMGANTMEMRNQWTGRHVGSECD
jgi:hypothetical protein